MTEIVSNRVGYDIDDTLVGREFITRFGGFLRGRLGYSLPKYTLDNLPIFDHTPADASVSGAIETALWFHIRRRAIPNVAERLRTQISEGVELFAISGRPATLRWHDATANQFHREGIPISDTRIILTPVGVSTAVSKAAAIRALGIEEYSDDNLKTLIYLAGLYPERRFNWIRYGLTDILATRRILIEKPNIQEISINKWSGSVLY